MKNMRRGRALYEKNLFFLQPSARLERLIGVSIFKDRFLKGVSGGDFCERGFHREKGSDQMKQLVVRAQRERDPEAFIRLMEENRQSMLKVAKSFLSSEQDVADAMQESILACYEKLDSLKNPQYFKTWLIRIVINKCKDILRQNREVLLTGDFSGQAAGPGSARDSGGAPGGKGGAKNITVPAQNAAGLAAEDASYAEVEFRELLSRIDEKYRTILVLYYVEGFRTGEIAELLDLNENTVKSRLMRARKQFAREYENKEGIMYG